MIVIIFFNIIFSGCINPPSLNSKQSTLEKDNNIENPLKINNQNVTILEDPNDNNETVPLDIKDVNALIPKNNEEYNESIPKDKEENKEEILENLDDNNNETIKELYGVVDAINQFAIDFYLELIRNNKENIFFSPYSISTAFAIAYEGARGKTASEIQLVFHFPENNDIRRNDFLKICNEINKEEKKYNLSTANALWAEKSYKFLAEYFNIIEKYYGGNVTNLDFINDPEGSRKIINSWVENQTNEKIKNLIPQGVIDELTRLVITNAIYFKGNWKIPFDEDYTSEKDFYINSNNSIKVPMMYLKDSFNYTKTKDFQILELPYESDELSMLILLPNENNLSSYEGSINIKNLSEWKNNLTETKIKIYIPKFKFETKYEMKETLKEMGMQSAFNPKYVDFSGMDGTKNLYIKSVIHQAFVEVNEVGTEAAAATTVIGGVLSMPPPTPVFRADHPFIFLIHHKESGNILFMGKVVDPTS